MIEAVMFWNEPNNLAHWDLELDPDWSIFARMVKLAGERVRAEAPRVTQVLGGISPIDATFLANMRDKGVLAAMDVVAAHGFPLDWNHWSIDEWPRKIEELRGVTDKPIWVSEAGASSYGAEEVQDFGLARTCELLLGRVPRVHWYSLYDRPRAWLATPRGRDQERSSYHRGFHMGLLREDGSPKRALKRFADVSPALGVCQWFEFEDPRLRDAVKWLTCLGVTHVRTSLSWAEYEREGGAAWFDRLVRALEPFAVTLTFGSTPEKHGRRPHPSSPPVRIDDFAEFCGNMVRRYAR